ncbi:MAG: (d)CMP kinase [Eubacteriaceae bacterium]|jgi:cytidylate kinase|nr:(d)CMP kinase [Eubacteriaceae bacterium]
MKIAIDGPAGAGKSTVAKIIADRLDLTYIDTGAMYRAIAYGLIHYDISETDSNAIVDFVREAEISLRNNRVYLNDLDVTSQIREPEVSQMTSVVSVIKEVRNMMVDKQRQIAKGSSVVMDGRDIGSVVLPDADYKFYLDANLEERARRRENELEEKGISQTFESVKEDMVQRDFSDMNRQESPLVCTEDAIKICTDHLTIDEVVQKMIEAVGDGHDL